MPTWVALSVRRRLQVAVVERLFRSRDSVPGSHPVFGHEMPGDKFAVFAEVLDVVPLPAFPGMEDPRTVVPLARGPDEFKGIDERLNGRLGSSWSTHDYLIHQVAEAADTRTVHQARPTSRLAP